MGASEKVPATFHPDEAPSEARDAVARSSLGTPRALAARASVSDARAQQVVARSHALASELAGATTPGDPAAWPRDAGEFAARWNALEPARRDSLVQLMTATSQDAERCFVMNHATTIEHLEQALAETRLRGAARPSVTAEEDGRARDEASSTARVCPSCGSSNRFAVQPPCSLDQFDPDAWHSTFPHDGGR